MGPTRIHCGSAMLTTAVMAFTTLPTAIAADVVLFPYFLENGNSGIYLAASDDGRNFRPLNNGQPIFTPPQWPDGQHLTRDPSIVFHDGLFHLVWTSNWSGRVFGHASSPDLKTWSTPQMIAPFPESLPRDEQPDNVWAPEIHFDPAQQNFQIVVSSTVPREENDSDGSTDPHGHDHRLYEIRTEDFKKFTSAKALFDQDFCVIDGQLAFDDRDTPDENDDCWIMSFKREDAAPDGKNIRLSFNNAPQSGDWSRASAPLLGPGSPLRANQQVEGPALVRFKGQWLLYADAFNSGGYTLITSPDLEKWTDETEKLKLPTRHPRHGTPFVVDPKRIGWQLD